jgi:hypothetical protein
MKFSSQQTAKDDDVKIISKTALYRQLKVVSDDVMNHGQSYIVFQGSKPAFQITPISKKSTQKKYTKNDIHKFIFVGTNSDPDLARNYKKALYS